MSSPPSQNLHDNDGAAHISYPSDGLQALQAATSQMDHQHDASMAADSTDQQNRDVTPPQHQHAIQTTSYPHHPILAPNPMPSPGSMSDPATLASIAAAAQDGFHSTGAPSTSIHGPVPIAQAQLLPQVMPQAMQQIDQHGHSIRDPSQNPKLSRLSRACDNCSARKVKCSETLPCKACVEHNIECTNDRAVKRRGPPNKAIALLRSKKARLSADDSANTTMDSMDTHSGSTLSLGTNAHTAAATLANLAVTESGVEPAPAKRLSIEAIAPLPMLQALVEDFFTYIHPLCPFPHQPTFQAAFRNAENRTNPEFLALLASMVAALVASFPRSARNYLKAQPNGHMFPRASVMVEKCIAMAREARGTHWVDKKFTVDDGVTSYFLGLAAGYLLRTQVYQYHMQEALTIMRCLGYHAPKHPGETPTFGNDTCEPDGLSFDHIKDQIGKRLFWCIFLGVRSMYQFDKTRGGLEISVEVPDLPYPIAPANADDMHIQPHEVVEQDAATITLMTGFNMVKSIYMTMNGVVGASMSVGLEYHPWSEQRRLVKEGLLAVKSVINDLPPDLQFEVQERDEHENPVSSIFDSQNLQYFPPSPSHPQGQQPDDLRSVIKAQPQVRRLLQFEIQKANIYVSWLATRSFFVELYFVRRTSPTTGYDPALQMLTNGGEVSPEDAIEQREEEDVRAMMTQEREAIIDDLLRVLGYVSKRNLEPNGGSLISKIRQITSHVVQNSAGQEMVSDRHKEALEMLLGVVARLERTGPSSIDGEGLDLMNMTNEDEVEEKNTWLALADFKARFTHNGYAGN